MLLNQESAFHVIGSRRPTRRRNPSLEPLEDRCRPSKNPIVIPWAGTEIPSV